MSIADFDSKRLLLFIFVTTIFFFISSGVYSQDYPKRALDSMERRLFVHTDKTIYTNEEDIWFSAYLLKSIGISFEAHSVLTVALTHRESKAIILQDKFLMSDGLSMGSLHIPDTIESAQYDLLFNTNVVDRDSVPQAIFSQPLTIRNVNRTSLKAFITLLDTVRNKGVFRFKVGGLPLYDYKKKLAITYSIGPFRKHEVITQKNTDFIITLPDSLFKIGYQKLFVKLSHDNEDQYLQTSLPRFLKNTVSLRFFPEGGSLVTGLPGVVVMESRDEYGTLTPIEAELYENDKFLKRISTNNRGTGNFQITVLPEKSYKIKVDGHKDQVFSLPEPLAKGTILSLPDVVVDDTLKIRLMSDSPTPVHVYLHNEQGIYAKIPVMTSKSGSRIAVVLDSVPRGIIRCSVLDSEEHPIAEQLFFAHYNRATHTSVTTEKEVYGKREKVTLTIKVSDSQGNPLSGVMSFAVVQAFRINALDFQDIRDYRELGDLGKPPKDILGYGLQNKELIDEYLRVRGWRRYTWQALRKNMTIENPVIINGINGYVSERKRPLKKALSINFFNSSNTMTFETKNTGAFSIPETALLSDARKNILFSVAKVAKENYVIHIQDPYFTINSNLSAKLPLKSDLPANSSLGLFADTLANNAQMLKTVNITGNNGAFFNRDKNANECGDFVTASRYLNDMGNINRPGNTAPVIGQTYIDPNWAYVNGVRVRTSEIQVGQVYETAKIVYQGCNLKAPYLFPARGIYTDMEFYGMADSEDNDRASQTTLLWKPGIMIEAGKVTEFSFLTGDVTGEFKVIAQGVSGNNVLFSSEKFTIK